MSYFPESISPAPMNPEIKRQWLEALRSGEYKQGQQALKKKTAKGELQYCCLGVLCELHRKATKKFQWQEIVNYEPSVYLYNAFKAFLPREVNHWAGLHRSYLTDNLAAETILAEANDNGADFPAIANWIEANL